MLTFTLVALAGATLGWLAKLLVWGRKKNGRKVQFYSGLGVLGGLWGAYLLTPLLQKLGWVGEGWLPLSLSVVAGALMSSFALPFLLLNRKV